MSEPAAVKPCPWCPVPVRRVVRFVSEAWDAKQQVVCRRCGARGPEADTEAAAIAAWNQRKDVSQGVTPAADAVDR